LRHGLGARWLERDVVVVSGPDAVEYLQGQCSQDVAALGVGATADALLLSPQGKLEALVRVTRTAPDALVVDSEGGFGDVVLARLQRFKLRVKVTLERGAWPCLALRGPGAAACVGSPGAPSPLVLPFSWNGVVGVDLLGATPELPAAAVECSPDAWEALRVEAGIPAMGSELDDRTIAAEADLLERCVSFSKGCYTGQELVARLDARGNRVARRLCGLVLGAGEDGSPPVGRGDELVVGEKVVGSLTSVAWSPALGRTVALGYVQRAVVPPATLDVRVRAAPTGAGEPVRAEVRALPLVGAPA